MLKNCFLKCQFSWFQCFLLVPFPKTTAWLSCSKWKTALIQTVVLKNLSSSLKQLLDLLCRSLFQTALFFFKSHTKQAVLVTLVGFNSKMAAAFCVLSSNLTCQSQFINSTVLSMLKDGCPPSFSPFVVVIVEQYFLWLLCFYLNIFRFFSSWFLLLIFLILYVSSFTFWKFYLLK